MHALIHMCRVLHNKTFSKKKEKKIFTILFKNIKSVNDETTRKSPLVILTGWSFEHFKGFGVTRPERDLESSSWTWQVRRP